MTVATLILLSLSFVGQNPNLLWASRPSPNIGWVTAPAKAKTLAGASAMWKPFVGPPIAAMVKFKSVDKKPVKVDAPVKPVDVPLTPHVDFVDPPKPKLPASPTSPPTGRPNPPVNPPVPPVVKAIPKPVPSPPPVVWGWRVDASNPAYELYGYIDANSWFIWSYRRSRAYPVGPTPARPLGGWGGYVPSMSSPMPMASPCASGRCPR